MMHDVKAVARGFALQGDFVSAAPYGGGHINDTYTVVYDQGGTSMRYIFQRINHTVFKDPAALMENIARVLDHSHQYHTAKGTADASRRSLTLISSQTAEWANYGWYAAWPGGVWFGSWGGTGPLSEAARPGIRPGNTPIEAPNRALL